MLLLSLFFYEGDRSTEILGKLPKVTELLREDQYSIPGGLVPEPALDHSSILMPSRKGLQIPLKVITGSSGSTIGIIPKTQVFK